MYITVEGLHFCAAHRLMHHPGKCRYLHGHNFQIVSTFYGAEPDPDTGMVVDFGAIKPVVEEAVDSLDHLTILNVEDKDYIAFLRKKSDRVVIMGNEPTCEEIGRFLFTKITTMVTENPRLANRIVLTELRIWETAKFSATININDIDDEE
ncbi:MAG: 6-pyruvoyl trahydropterin synthase family protein [Candidatus Thorarchaeota archaeon]|jgi:6-pyruvoyltetrahydropterin/6-carboxytetrahydropterin synthase